MRGVVKTLAALFASAALFAGAAWLVRAEAPAPPRVASLTLVRDLPVGSLPPRSADSPDDAQVVLRLLDRLGSLTVSHALPGGERLAGHWRRMKPPWLGADAPDWVQVVALLASGEERAPLGDPTQSPEVRTWNKNLGAFEQWTSLALRAGEEATFALEVPRGGQLRADVAVARGGRAVFRAVAETATGRRVECVREASEREGPGSPWRSFGCELGALSGESVKLRLGVEGGEATGLWGGPRITGPREGGLPWNVLWIVVDALRPDALAAWHRPQDDARWAAARRPPLEAWLPRLEGLTPAMDRLVREGVSFRQAHSNAAWTRPGTLAMLSGMRSGELGVDPDQMLLASPTKAAFYASRPPLLPLVLGRAGARTDAILNNYFLVGYAAVGLDLGFDHLLDIRHQTEDTAQIERATLDYLDAHSAERFFLFCNLVSPHPPYEPPPEALARVPAAPVGPEDPIVRDYLGEVAKDDMAIGRILERVDALGLRRRTLVVLTADHGEVMSRAHRGVSRLERLPVRFGHISSNFEETTRIPLVLSLPGVLPEGRSLDAPVQSVDLAPTVEQIEGLTPGPRPTGRSLVGLMVGPDAPDLPRPVVSEGRFSRALLLGRHRYLERRGEMRETWYGDRRAVADAELYDLVDDPGETEDLSTRLSPLTTRMQQALAELTASDPRVIPPHRLATTLRLRVGGAGQRHTLEGSLRLASSGPPGGVVAVGDPGACRLEGPVVVVKLASEGDELRGCDLTLPYPTPEVAWSLRWDGRPLDDSRLHVGSLTAPIVGGEDGLRTDAALRQAFAPWPPHLDPLGDEGVFVWTTQDAPGALVEGSAEQMQEASELFRSWGYAHAP